MQQPLRDCFNGAQHNSSIDICLLGLDLGYFNITIGYNLCSRYLVHLSNVERCQVQVVAASVSQDFERQF